MASSDEEDISVQDGDSCTLDELQKLFKSPLYLSTEEAISLKKNYILHLDASCTFDRVVVSTSIKTTHLFDLRHSDGLYGLSQLDISNSNVDDICGVKFSNNNPNLIFISTVAGKIYLHDTRASDKAVETFELDGRNNKPLTCLDVNNDDSIICAGTEQASTESFLLFFDTRQRTSLGAYRDSHTDDITQVKFHPQKHNIIATGSTDGLINIFDISNKTEEDALQHCLNTESSVQTINWHQSSEPEKNRLSCITHTNDFHLYDVEESEQIVAFNRDAITKLIKRKSSSECYLINGHTTISGEVLLLTGSNHNKGECLRTLALNGKEFNTRNNLLDNKQIVRCSVYNDKNDILITAGEGGIVSVWQNQIPIQTTSASGKQKQAVKLKNRKTKPY